jgi:hypothetical protein
MQGQRRQRLLGEVRYVCQGRNRPLRCRVERENLRGRFTSVSGNLAAIKDSYFDRLSISRRRGLDCVVSQRGHPGCGRS